MWCVRGACQKGLESLMLLLFTLWLRQHRRLVICALEECGAHPSAGVTAQAEGSET